MVNDFIDYAAGYHVTFMVERRKPSHENKRNRAAQDWLADVNPDLSNMTNKEILAALKIAYPDLFITGGERWIRYQKVFPKKEPGCKPKRK